jgi:hypothetical protein
VSISGLLAKAAQDIHGVLATIAVLMLRHQTIVLATIAVLMLRHQTIRTPASRQSNS